MLTPSRACLNTHAQYVHRSRFGRCFAEIVLLEPAAFVLTILARFLCVLEMSSKVALIYFGILNLIFGKFYFKIINILVEKSIFFFLISNKNPVN